MNTTRNTEHSAAEHPATEHSAIGLCTVRFSILGYIGRFTSDQGRRYPRGCKVVLQTSRGLEVGEVLGSGNGVVDEKADGKADGKILRAITDADRLLLERLDRHRLRAMAACEKMLADRGLSAALVDVEHLFDGESLFFYFLGGVTPEVQSLTAELAETYDTSIQFRRFAQTLAEGCGPDCGTKEGDCGGRRLQQLFNRGGV